MSSPRHLAAYADPYALAEAIAHLCEDPHPEKEGWRARCPNHQGTSDTSLSLTPGEDRVLLNCFGGCTTQAVLGALHLTMADLFIKTGKKSNGLGQIIKIYDYYDAAGTLVHQTVRYSPKAFRQRRPDPAHAGRYIWNLHTIQPVLYHLPDVLMGIQTQEPIYLVEGEKDADTLVSMGFIATCNPMGAGKWEPTYSENLRGASVVILVDFDTPGTKHAELLALTLHGIVKDIRVIYAMHTDTPGSDVTDWFEAGGTKEELEAIVNTAPFYAPPAGQPAAPGWSVSGVPGATLSAGMQPGAWRKDLFSKKNGELTQNVLNIMRILEHHDYWTQPDHALWWDSVRGIPMCGHEEITDHLMMDIAAWFGEAERLPVTSPSLLERCIIAHCHKHSRDLLQLWLTSLPPWDGTPRLTTWLCDIAGLTLSEYVADTSRVFITSMVARALNPGCQYRFVVILEGPEGIGKSALVRTLATPDWFVELSIGLESKEAHMMLQGTWVAELADLDAMTRTEETRMKAFITMQKDSYIPKYSNFRQSTERRTIFVGTTNDETYLKGLSGNTRYLPIRLDHPVDLDALKAMRTMLFAEAMHYYQTHPDTWWAFCDEATEAAKNEREQRRVMQVYEHPLHEWLEQGRFEGEYFEEGKRAAFVKDETNWPEIAQHFLGLKDRDKWKDRSLQMQIAASLKGLGWEVKQARRHGRNTNVWRKPTAVPF